MNQQEQLLKYADQIKSMAVHAKSIGFDPVSGNWDDLFRSWIQFTYRASVFIENNKSDVMKMIRKKIERENEKEFSDKMHPYH